MPRYRDESEKEAQESKDKDGNSNRDKQVGYDCTFLRLCVRNDWWTEKQWADIHHHAWWTWFLQKEKGSALLSGALRICAIMKSTWTGYSIAVWWSRRWSLKAYLTSLRRFANQSVTSVHLSGSGLFGTPSVTVKRLDRNDRSVNGAPGSKCS